MENNYYNEIIKNSKHIRGGIAMKGNSKWKKLVTVALAGTMALSALTGCGNQETSENSTSSATGTVSESNNGSDSAAKVNLTMAWWGNQVRNEATQNALDKYHELNPNVTVDGQFYQWNDYWGKLSTSAAGKTMPDVIQMDYFYIDQYVQNNQLLDLTPYIESGALDVSNISDNVLAMGEIGDGNYGIAAGLNAGCLLYNKTLLDENGITMKDNMTLDEFIEVAKEVTEKTGYRANLMSLSVYYGYWSRANDLQLKDGKLAGDSAAAYEPYFQLLVDAINDGWHISAKDGIQQTTAVEQDPMVYGSSPETMSWCAVVTSNMLTSYQNAAPEGMEIGITTIPTSDVKKSNYLKPSQFFCVSADTANPDEAVALLNYLINSEDANSFLLGERGVPASSVISEYVAGKTDAKSAEAMDYINNVITPNCSPIDPPSPEGYSMVDDVMKKAEEKIQYGEITAQQAAEEYYNKGIEVLGAK